MTSVGSHREHHVTCSNTTNSCHDLGRDVFLARCRVQGSQCADLCVINQLYGLSPALARTSTAVCDFFKTFSPKLTTTASPTLFFQLQPHQESQWPVTSPYFQFMFSQWVKIVSLGLMSLKKSCWGPQQSRYQAIPFSRDSRKSNSRCLSFKLARGILLEPGRQVTDAAHGYGYGNRQ